MPCWASVLHCTQWWTTNFREIRRKMDLVQWYFKIILLLLWLQTNWLYGKSGTCIPLSFLPAWIQTFPTNTVTRLATCFHTGILLSLYIMAYLFVSGHTLSYSQWRILCFETVLQGLSLHASVWCLRTAYRNLSAETILVCSTSQF
jgi:hypothetical protein